jgi:nicotinate dehydrogenase subunit B
MSGETVNRARRGFLERSGVIVATFALGLPPVGAQTSAAARPVSFAKNGKLDGWIAVDDAGAVTVFTGKVELGQGILTALAQVAAEELDVDLDQVRIVSGSTVRGPDEGYTFGSQSVEQSGSALRAASALARATLVAAASKRFNVDPAVLTVQNGVVAAPDGRRLGYGEIVRDDPKLLDRDVSNLARPKAPETYRVVGKSMPRIDLPDKVMARGVYLQDMRMPGMVFGRVVRPPSAGAELQSIDEAVADSLPGVLAAVRLSSFLGVVAEREEQAITAAEALRGAARWKSVDLRLPNDGRLAEELERLASEDIVVKEAGRAPGRDEVARWVEATYSRPYLSHASIGPSCAVAKVERGRVTVWSHTQGPFPLRGDIAAALGLPTDYVQVIHVQAAGCYGHNGADDAALDAALLAMAVPGRPVKLQWSRRDEFAWSPAGPAMLMRAKAGLSAEGKVVDWDYALWSNSHASRPGQPGGLNLLGAWYLGKGHHISPPLKIPQPFGNGDRNAVPLYDFPRQRIVNHLLTEMPVRTSSLRTLGSHGNVFAIECFMDELAQAAGSDPVAFRLAHLTDARGRAVLQAAADAAGWSRPHTSDGRRGRGVAYTRYKNISTYVAVIIEIDLDQVTGKIRVTRAVAAADAGLVINPDGIISQCEGGIVQGLSWALKEQLRFDRQTITSTDWTSYPIMTFDEVPPIDVRLLNRPSDPSLGAGEATVGPASAALANALANATGKRLRHLPLTPDRVKALLG